MQTNSQTDIFDKPVKAKWKEVAPLSVGHTAHTAVLLQGSVYVGGGFEGKSVNKDKDCYTIDIYNVYADQWSTSPITTPYCAFAMTVLDDKLIIAGGRAKSGEITNKILMLYEGQWKYYNEMRTARCNMAAIGYKSMLITIGGETTVNNAQTDIATTELLDTTNGSWYTCDDLPMPHFQIKCMVIKNILYVLGGKHVSPSLQVFTASLDNLSSHRLKWRSLPDTPWCYSSPVVLYNKFLLTVGGRQPSDRNSQTSEVCAFNPSTGLWKQIANIPAARSFSAVVSVADNKIILQGGGTRQGKYSSDTWVGTFE